MRKSSVVGVVFSAALGVSSVACSSMPEDQTALGTTRSAIIGGNTSTAEQDAVVLLIHTDRQTSFGSCTGTLIAPNLLLTARHCVSNVNDSAFGCKSDGTPIGAGGKPGSTLRAEEFYVFTGTDRPMFGGGQARKASARGKKVFHDGAKTLCGHDLALILLDQDVEGAAIMPLRLDELPKAGESFTAVGWGVTDKSPYPNKRMQRSGIKVEAVGPFKGSATEAPIPENDFRVGESICSGDSGGPGIAEDTGAVIGVVSRGGNGSQDQNDPAAGCTGSLTTNEYTSVAPFKDVILQAFEEAGKEPWVEGGADPRLTKFNEECDSDAACRSGVCVANKCAQVCSEVAACPEGYTCSADGANKLCKPTAPPTSAATGGASSGGCVAGGGGPIGPVVPWALAALGAFAARRRRRNR